MNEVGGDQVVQRPELVDSDRAAQVRVAPETPFETLFWFTWKINSLSLSLSLISLNECVKKRNYV